MGSHFSTMIVLVKKKTPMIIITIMVMAHGFQACQTLTNNNAETSVCFYLGARICRLESTGWHGKIDFVFGLNKSQVDWLHRLFTSRSFLAQKACQFQVDPFRSKIENYMYLLGENLQSQPNEQQTHCANKSSDKEIQQLFPPIRWIFAAKCKVD